MIPVHVCMHVSVCESVVCVCVCVRVRVPYAWAFISYLLHSWDVHEQDCVFLLGSSSNTCKERRACHSSLSHVRRAWCVCSSFYFYKLAASHMSIFCTGSCCSRRHGAAETAPSWAQTCRSLSCRREPAGKGLMASEC
jgi:hypothetical protein